MDLSQGRILILSLVFFLSGLSDAGAALPDSVTAADTSSLASRLVRQGEWHIHARNFFMATDNKSPLTDYAAWAFGAGIGYVSPAVHGFQFGLTGFFIFNLASSDLGKPDPLAKSSNRYEIGLFDITDPYNKKDLDRLEELYLKYHYRKSWISAGRFELNTPFINRQDGRMRGTIEEGAWIEMNEIKNLKVEGGWLWKISPRSTVQWYSFGDVYGVYPQGLNESGVKSDYAGNVTSAGTALLGITWQKNRKLKLQAWEQFAEGVFNTALLRMDLRVPLLKEKAFIGGIQLVRQDALEDGGNPDPSKAYIRKGSHSHVISLRTGLKTGRKELTLNYTRITDNDRFLMPREWGREPFYTFLPRERNEGYSDVHAVNAALSWSLMEGRLSPSIAYGHYYLPDVKDVVRSKYGIPSYRQMNAELRYAFGGKLKGLSAQFLLVYKGRIGEAYGDYKYIFNKVDMYNWNFVIDYSI